MPRSLSKTIAVVLVVAMFGGGCAYRFLFWERNIWQDSHGIFAMAEPADMDLYRSLLPAEFTVPDQPMVGLYLVHFTDTEPWPITLAEFLLPYHEATILLRCEYQGQTGWYSVVMPVTTDNARPTCPTMMPHRPKAMPAGIRLGTRLMKPMRNDRSANIRIIEISTNATVVPVSIARMLRKPI